MSLEDDVRRDGEVAELRAALSRAQQQLARARRRGEEVVEAVYQAAHDAALAVGTPPPVPPPPKRRVGREGEEVGLLHLTDWQLGAGRGGAYGPDVCEHRIERCVQKVMRITDIERQGRPVRSLHIMLGGDMVEGVSIYPGQPWDVDASAFDQVFRASALIERVVVTLLGEFQKIHVWQVAGNHGRIGRKGDHPRHDNLDNMVYRIARDRLAGQRRLVWHDNRDWHQIVRVGEYRALLVHGDQIKSFGGNLPAFGIMRKATAWSSGVVEDFHDMWLGHFHQNMTLTLPNGGRVFMTGSPESGNEYAREFVAAKGKPSQRYALVDPEAGRLTGEWVLWLDD